MPRKKKINERRIIFGVINQYIKDTHSNLREAKSELKELSVFQNLSLLVDKKERYAQEELMLIVLTNLRGDIKDELRKL